MFFFRIEFHWLSSQYIEQCCATKHSNTSFIIMPLNIFEYRQKRSLSRQEWSNTMTDIISVSGRRFLFSKQRVDNKLSIIWLLQYDSILLFLSPRSFTICLIFLVNLRLSRGIQQNETNGFMINSHISLFLAAASYLSPPLSPNQRPILERSSIFQSEIYENC